MNKFTNFKDLAKLGLAGLMLSTSLQAKNPESNTPDLEDFLSKSTSTIDLTKDKTQNILENKNLGNLKINTSSNGVSISEEKSGIKKTFSTNTSNGQSKKFDDFTNAGKETNNDTKNYSTQNNTNMSVEGDNGYINWLGNIGVRSQISEISGGDTQLTGAFSMLYAGGEAGTYIGIKKGGDLDQFLLSQGIKVGENGMLKLSGAITQKLMSFYFSNVGEKEEKISQKSYGIDYTHNFDGILQELKTYVVYYDVKGKNLGTIGDIIINTSSLYDWTEVEGAIGGGNKLLAGIDASFRITDELKGTLGVGVDKTTYDAVLNEKEKDLNKITGKVGLEYQPNDYNNIDIDYSTREGSETTNIRYTHDFGNSLKAYVGASNTSFSNDGIEDDNRIYGGLNYTFGGKNTKSKLSTLYHDNNNTNLTHHSIEPNRDVASENITVVRKAQVNNHIVGIDKTVLLAGDEITLDSKNRITALKLDNSGFAVNSISLISNSQYSAFVSVLGGKLAIVDFKGLNQKMAELGLKKGDSLNLNLAVSDAGGTSIYSIGLTKGSVEITRGIKRLYNVTPEQAQAFVNGTKTFEQVENEKNIDNIAPVLNSTNKTFFTNAGTALNLENVTATDNKDGAVNVIVTGTVNFNVVGTYIVTYTATDTAGNTSTITHTYNVLGAQVAPIMGDVPNQTYTAGSAITNLNIASLVTLTNGDAISAYTLTGTLPTGLSFNSTTGVISGTPTQTGVFNLSVTATDNDGVSNSDSFSINVSAAEVPPVMGDVPNQTYTAGSAITNLNIASLVTLTNGDAISAYTLTGTLPTGLSFNSSTGVISGTPTQTGVFNLSVTATDNDGVSNSDSFSINVSAAEVPPVMGDVPNQTYTAGSAITNLNIASLVTLTNGDAISAYTLTGTLPAGLTFNSSTGVISGTPTQTGVFNLSVTATDNDGVSNSDSFSINVSAAEVPPVMGDVPNQTYTAGSTITNLNIASLVTLTNGDAISAYTLTGTLPAGLTFNSSTGVISGTPTETGVFNLSVTATDNDGVSNSDSFSITVNAAPDTTLPGTPNLSINSGADYTNSTTVSLGITNDTDNVGVTGWFVSESSSVPTVSDGRWSSSKPTSFNISSGDGVKTIYIWTKDAAGNVSLAGSDTITLDTTVQNLSTESITGPFNLGGSASGTMTFNLNGDNINEIASFTNIKIKDSNTKSDIGGTVTANMSGNVATLTITWPSAAPSKGFVYIEGTAKDRAGNTKTIRTSGDYELLNTAPVVQNITGIVGKPNIILDRREAVIDMSSYISDAQTLDSSLRPTFSSTNPEITFDTTSAWPIVQINGRKGRSGNPDIVVTYKVNDGSLDSNEGTINLSMYY